MVRILVTWLLAVGLAVGAPGNATLPISAFHQPTLYECAAALDQSIRASAAQSGHRTPDPVMDARRLYYQARTLQVQGLATEEIGRLILFGPDPILKPWVQPKDRRETISRYEGVYEQGDPPLPADDDQAKARCYLISQSLWPGPDSISLGVRLRRIIPEDGLSIATSVMLSAYRQARDQRDVEVLFNTAASTALAEPIDTTFAKCARRFPVGPLEEAQLAAR